MIDYQDEILQDFLSRADELDSAAQAGLDLIRSNDVQSGIDAVLRPIHTIKGTAGFIGGLEKLQAFAHRTEDYLRQAQNGGLELTSERVDLLLRAVDGVFELIEQLKNQPPELDDAELQKVLASLEGGERAAPAAAKKSEEAPVFLAHSAGQVLTADSALDDQVVREGRDGVTIFRVKTSRIHLPLHYNALTSQLQKIGKQEVVLLDLSAVRTISSTAWGEIWKAGADKRPILIGMKAAVEATFKTWNLGRYFERFATEAAFWEQFQI